MIVDRRRLIVGLGATGLLSGCDRLNQSAGFRKLLMEGDSLHYTGQRLIQARTALAHEYHSNERSPVFRMNGSTHVDDPAYQQHAANNFADWRLIVDGLVTTPLALPMAALLGMPQRTQITRHDCVEGWSAIGGWTGPQLGPILKLAGLKDAARYIVFHCADTLGGNPYYESIDLVDAFHPQTILAHALNGQPLPIGHGAPIRARIERQLGYKQAKFVMRVEARATLAGLFGGGGGYWEDHAGYEWYAGV